MARPDGFTRTVIWDAESSGMEPGPERDRVAVNALETALLLESNRDQESGRERSHEAITYTEQDRIEEQLRKRSLGEPVWACCKSQSPAHPLDHCPEAP